MSAQMDDALQTLIVESRELLQHMEEALLLLEQTPDDAEAVNAIFRAAHTIKGGAGVVEINSVEKFTHVLENVLDRLRNGEIEVSGDMISALLAGCEKKPEPVTLPEVNAENCKPENIAKIEDKGVQQAFSSLCLRRGGEFKPSPKREW